MRITPLTGLVAASFTPFDSKGRLDVRRVPALAADLRKNKVSASLIAGTTGEGSSLTVKERLQLAEAWAGEKGSGLSLAVHVGHNCLADCITLARHAAKIGADAIAQIAPSYLRPASLADLVDTTAAVAAAAPELPYYYYHFPEITGVNFDMAEYLRMAGPKIPNLAGVKFTYYDMKNFLEALTFEGGRYAVLHGRDETLLTGLALGATGAIGSTYNYGAPIYHRVIRAFKAGDLEAARREQALAVRMVNVVIRHGGGLVAGKAIMKMNGIDCGGMRLPLRTLDAAGETRLRADLETAGYFAAIAAKK